MHLITPQQARSDELLHRYSMSFRSDKMELRLLVCIPHNQFRSIKLSRTSHLISMPCGAMRELKPRVNSSNTIQTRSHNLALYFIANLICQVRVHGGGRRESTFNVSISELCLF